MLVFVEDKFKRRLAEEFSIVAIKGFNNEENREELRNKLLAHKAKRLWSPKVILAMSPL